MKPFICFLSLIPLLMCSCTKPYTPKEMTEEEQTLQQELVKYQDQLKAALKNPAAYVQVAVVDRKTTFPDDDQEYTRVLVLQREQLDLDDYGFSPPGKEASEADEDYIEGFFNDVMFWVDNDGKILFDDFEQPPGTEMVVEWCIPNGDYKQVALHYGGNPCLVIDLDQ
ncbi:hypothetical protein F1728_27030 [Gimesia benthica]|uniref:Uncharacterized protein n=1 Tax=Gimesia benthica TaxID=2608982 RepID=A0A6I6AIM1_9PLAN|nr:hypothetical protein [Gimesia benthica]QGQ26108.1 hypothetical protein F1728_27030 [Gimesia benthica]